MGKETSYKLRNEGAAAGAPPDTYVGRKAVELGLITAEQLKRALEQVAEESALTNDLPPTLCSVLISSGILSESQVDVLLESRSVTPKRLGKYRIGQKLGQGGMGVVYEAEDQVLERRCAFKMLRYGPSEDPVEAADEEERFVREARLCGQIPKHPHIVSVYEAGVLDGRRFIAMELVRGTQFQEWRARKTTPFRQKIAVLRDVALAVDHAHAHGVVHRDLKPANILIDEQNEPHVTDFGLAKKLNCDGAHELTSSGFTMGTPAYVSPEQAQGRRDVDCRTDVWALGVILYELLTDRLPFEGQNALEMLIKAVRDPISPPSSHHRRSTGASPDPVLEIICMKALAKEPKDRYPSARALATDLTRWLKGQRVLTRRSQRSSDRMKIAVCAGLAALGIAALFIVLWPSSESRAAAARAEHVAKLVSAGHKFLHQNRPADALIEFGRALAEDPGCRPAQAGKKEAQEKMMAAARAEAKPPAAAAPSTAAAAAPPPPRVIKPTRESAPPASDLPPPTGAVELAPLTGHVAGVHLVAFTPDGRSLVTAGFDNTVRLWDVAGRRERKRLAESVLPASVGVSNDGRWIAAGFLDSALKVWDASGTLHRSYSGHELQVTGIAFTPDGKELVSSSTDASARSWDVASGTQKSRMEGYPKGAMCLALSRDGRTLAVGSADRLVRILEYPSCRELLVLSELHETVVTSVAFSPDGKTLLSGGKDGAVVVTELESGRQRTIGAHAKSVYKVAFSPDGRWIASTSVDSTLRLWSGPTKAPAGSYRGDGAFYGLAFSPDSELLAAGTREGGIRVWNLKAAAAAK